MYERFKRFCREHNISVATFLGVLGTITFTVNAIVEKAGGWDYTALPPRLQQWIAVGLAVLVMVGRYAGWVANIIGGALATRRAIAQRSTDVIVGPPIPVADPAVTADVPDGELVTAPPEELP